MNKRGRCNQAVPERPWLTEFNGSSPIDGHADTASI